jgi:hypothetical protein
MVNIVNEHASHLTSSTSHADIVHTHEDLSIYADVPSYISTSDRALGLDNVTNTIYVRQCYRNLWKLFVEMNTRHTKALLITGNPGIGKSLFAGYILYRILLDRWIYTPSHHFNIVYENQAAQYKLVLSTDGSVQKFQSAGEVESLLMDNPDTFYIFDASVKHFDEPSPSTCRTIVLSSPDVENYKEWSKRHEARLYMPEWSSEELQQAFTMCLTDEQRHSIPTAEVVAERYGFVGGIARHVFSPEPTQKLIAQLNQEINVCDLHKVGKAGESLEKLKGTSHWVLCYNVTQDFDTDGMKPVSPYVTARLVQREHVEAHNDLMRFLRDTVDAPRAGTLRGYLFEEYAHKMLQNGGDFIARPLKGKDIRATHTVNFAPSTFKALNNVDSIKLLHHHECGHPSARNFPTVDAVMRPNRLLQMTVRDKHSINVDGLNAVLNGLTAVEPITKKVKGGENLKADYTSHPMPTAAPSSFDFYFVLPTPPDALFHKYKLPNIPNEQSIQGQVQYYALQLPLKDMPN